MKKKVHEIHEKKRNILATEDTENTEALIKTNTNDLRSISRPHPETNENQHQRFAQHIGSPRRGVSTYLLIWFGLLVLTGVTVTVAGLNLGNLSVLGAILIAAVKSTLVVLFFMHIKYEDRVFKIMLGVAIITLVVIMVLTFVDVSFR